jgi:hypothetical protein
LRTRSYNKEIQQITAQVIDVFNNIVIDRRDALDNIQQLITVPCTYGAMSRIYKSALNRGQTIKLPQSAISITGISRDTSRVHSVNEEVKRLLGNTFDPTTKVANPINIDYTLSIMTKYIEDMDQIIGNFIPWFNSDIYVVVPHPQGIGNMKIQLVWSGDVNYTYPEEITETDPWRVLVDCSFTAKAWMFAGMPGERLEGKLIKHINFSTKDDGDGSAAHLLDKFYDVPLDMSVQQFVDNAKEGLILDPNFDFLPISGDMGGYWQSVSGRLSGQVYDPLVSGDVVFLLENFNDPGLEIFFEPGFISTPMSEVDFYDVWSRMLSGDLSSFFEGQC